MHSFKAGDVVARNSQPTQPMDVLSVEGDVVKCRSVAGEESFPATILQHYTPPEPTISYGRVAAYDEARRAYDRLGG
ncbi:MAG: hypothetical protein K8U57_15880 [Planctomycetes bacterium]|nr:hypothetical protein [Planctomycetota bacterium]